MTTPSSALNASGTRVTPYYAPDRRPAPSLARQADALEVAAEHWWSLYTHLARTAEERAWKHFDVGLTLKAGAATLRRLAALAEATSDAQVEELLCRAEERAEAARAHSAEVRAVDAGGRR